MHTKLQQGHTRWQYIPVQVLQDRVGSIHGVEDGVQCLGVAGGVAVEPRHPAFVTLMMVDATGRRG